MRFLIVRTVIRAPAEAELLAAMAAGRRLRDERIAPEHRRQIARAANREAALLRARALAKVGAVRSGRQRVKVLCLDDPAPRTDPGRRTEPARSG